MKLQIKKIPASIIESLKRIEPFFGFIFLILAIVSYGLFVLRIAQLNNAQPSDTQLSEKIQEVQKSKVDQNAVNKIQQLQDQNVQVQSIFKQARDNPFNE